MKSFKLKETCVICGRTAGLMRCNSKIGPICENCLDKLVNRNINASNIKKYNVYQLRAICFPIIKKPEPNLSANDRLEQMVIKNPGISLLNDEECVYRKPAKAVHQKNVVTGSRSNGGGVSLRVAKGVTIHTGGGGSSSIRENVNEFYDGMLFITNKRIVLLAPKYGFDIMSSDVSTILYQKDGMQIYVGAKCYWVYTEDMENINKLFDLMNQVFLEQEKNESRGTVKEDNNTITQLREFKKLLDEGVITQEDYDAKKKQLLEL